MNPSAKVLETLIKQPVEIYYFMNQLIKNLPTGLCTENFLKSVIHKTMCASWVEPCVKVLNDQVDNSSS